MRVFVTGASGHIGSAVVPELLEAGHQVVGLARSDSSATALEAAGAEVRRGNLEDLDGLREAVAAADGVIHLAFDHAAMRSGDFAGAIESGQRAIEAMAAGLEGSAKAPPSGAADNSTKPFVGTSGTLMLMFAGITGRPGTEQDVVESGPRVESENFVVGLAERGIRSSVVRLPPIVHSDLDHHGFAPALIAIARESGVAAFVGDGSNRWPSVHTRDAARVYRLALEAAPAGSRLHAVADEGIPFREIAEVIGRKLDVPTASIPAEDAEEHFSYLGSFVAMDNPTSSELTRRLLSWKPAHRGLLADLDQGHYFEPALVS